MEKVLEGQLARFEVPDLLGFLNMARRTGVLVLERPDQETKIFFREGRPIYANSTLDELRLGGILVRQGKVSEAALERALSRRREPGYRIGQRLLAEGVLEAADLPTFLKVQVSEVIFDTFEWRGGVFTFFDNVPPPATAVTLDVDIQNLLMEGVRRIDARARLKEIFPDLRHVAEALANPERIKQTVTLTQGEWQVLFLVDGRRTLAEICQLAGNADELATLQILHNLVSANFVSVTVPRTAPAESLPEAVPADGEGTLRFRASAVAAAAAPVSVELRPEPAQVNLEADTKEIVSEKAVGYFGPGRRITASRLVLLGALGPETSFPLVKDSSTLGRHRNNDIVISDPKVSSFHARIDRGSDGFAIVDLSSRNGTWVNGRRVESSPLASGDEIRLGAARLSYKVDYSSSAG